MLKFAIQVSGMDNIKHELAQRSTRTEHIVANQVMKDTRPFVPFLTGDLDARTRVDGNLVIYPGPQSRYLYYGKLMVDQNTGSSYAPLGATKVLTDRDLVFTKDFHPMAQSHWFEVSKAQNIDKWERVAERAEKHGR